MKNVALLNAVLALPPEERMTLALRALESVDDSEPSEVCATEAEWDEAWAVEIEARLARNEPSVPLQDVIDELRSRRG